MNRTNPQGGRRGYYTRYIKHYTKKNTTVLLLGALFLAGVLFGTLCIRTAGGDTVDALLRIVGAFVESRREQTMLENFTSGLFSSAVFLVVLFVCGFCAISQPLVIAAPLFRGLGVGFSMASLYASHGSSAIGYVGLLMIPGTVVSTVAVVLCCRESLRLSACFFAAMSGGQKEFYSLRIYVARYFACAVLCVLAAFLESVLYFAFANSFVLG